MKSSNSNTSVLGFKALAVIVMIMLVVVASSVTSAAARPSSKIDALGKRPFKELFGVKARGLQEACYSDWHCPDYAPLCCDGVCLQCCTYGPCNGGNGFYCIDGKCLYIHR
eukprot:TRINITY_DN526_c0_g1_i2.p2 TRINITY_DN526_c0_g1~~TRINITY_DN526_c0_g1_i2.p2  ORF type:complete len:111 (+),score=10.57 TRINITY_DN526_c0_g1_i2:413-745(+)